MGLVPPSKFKSSLSLDIWKFQGSWAPVSDSQFFFILRKKLYPHLGFMVNLLLICTM